MRIGSGNCPAELRRTAAFSLTRSEGRPMRTRLRFLLRAIDDTGGAMVEFAMILPLLMLMVTGIFSFGIACNNYLELTEATSSGALEFSQLRSNTTDLCADTAKAVYLGAPYLTQTNMKFSYAIISSGGTTTWSNNYTGGSVTCPAASTSPPTSDLVQGATASLTVTYPCNLSVYGWNYAPSCLLKAQTSELIQ